MNATGIKAKVHIMIQKGTINETSGLRWIPSFELFAGYIFLA